jgi:hypothetical protein
MLKFLGLFHGSEEIPFRFEWAEQVAMQLQSFRASATGETSPPPFLVPLEFPRTPSVLPGVFS